MSLIELGELEANEQIPRIGDLELAILPEHCEHLHLHLHLIFCKRNREKIFDVAH